MMLRLTVTTILTIVAILTISYLDRTEATDVMQPIIDQELYDICMSRDNPNEDKCNEFIKKTTD